MTLEPLRDDPAPRVLSLVKRHGWDATAFQTLGRGFRYHFGDEGCVAYVDTGGAWVAAGAPLAPDDRLDVAAARFADEARRNGRRACFFATESRFVERAGLRALRVGEQPEWDPRAWADTLRAHRGLREQLRRARAKGVRVSTLDPAALTNPAGDARRALDGLVARWAAVHAMAPMRFLVEVDLARHASERRCVVAERDGALVGVASMVPVPARGGWFLEDLVRDPGAPNGTTEALVDASLRLALEAGAQWFTMGLCPLAGDLPAPLRLARRWGRWLYDFDGLRAFKARLHPAAWRPIHLSFPSTQGAVSSVYDVLRAFAGRSLAGFALATAAHRVRRRRVLAAGPEHLLHG